MAVGSWLPRVGATIGIWVGNWLECAGFIGILALDGCSYPSTVHHRPDEPTGAVLPPEALEKADLVIAPALAVDPQGNRLGRGAGWYDRALARRKPACPLIAVCWPWEVLDTDLPAEPHDVPADGVLTPGGYRRLGESGRLS